MCGGMRTEASRYYSGHVPQGVCADCDSGCVPGLSHVLWGCSGYARDPDIGRGDPLAERLGWSAPAGN
eukprot:9075643-Alexandrium_andersonii.AAC.1